MVQCQAENFIDRASSHGPSNKAAFNFHACLLSELLKWVEILGGIMSCKDELEIDRNRIF